MVEKEFLLKLYKDASQEKAKLEAEFNALTDQREEIRKQYNQAEGRLSAIEELLDQEDLESLKDVKKSVKTKPK